MNVFNKRSFAIYITIAVVVVLIANIISRNLFFRLDFTDNKMYSLSSSSKAVLNKIDDLMTIKVYFSENLPGEYGNNRRFLQDILEEYSAYSDGKLRFEFFMPDEDEDLSQEAQKYGIQPVQLQVVENDKLEIKRVHMGLVILYEDKRETIPIIQTTTGLEYDITTKIKKLVDIQRKSVAFASIENQNTTNEYITNALRESYTVQSIKLANPVPAGIQMVLMNGVSDSLNATEYQNLWNYLVNGGNLLLGQARVSADLQTQQGTPVKSNIFDLIDEFGLHVQENLVLDQVCGSVTVQQRTGIFSFNTAMEYPFFPLVRDFADHTIVSGLEQLRLFFTSEIVTDSTSGTIVPLFSTSNRSGTMNGYYNLSPVDNPMLKNLSQPPKTIAAYASATLGDENVTAQLIMVGDSEMMSDNGGGRSPENMVFVMNAVDYLIGDSELVALRSREITTRPLEELEDGSKARWKWMNIILPAFLVIGVGFINWKREAGRTKQLEELYD